jgi:hypothetical protein
MYSISNVTLSYISALVAKGLAVYEIIVRPPPELQKLAMGEHISWYRRRTRCNYKLVQLVHVGPGVQTISMLYTCIYTKHFLPDSFLMITHKKDRRGTPTGSAHIYITPNYQEHSPIVFRW